MQIRSSNGAPTTTVSAMIETHAITNTPTVIATSTTLGTTATNARIGDSSPFPPNGTTFRPTVTTTSRPQIWVQRISEGWTCMLPLKDADSGDSNLHIPHSSLEEEVPENLGDEWRILHPFDLLALRHPTDTNPCIKEDW